MIVRVEWAKPNSDGFKMYHTYECDEYFVEFTGFDGECSLDGNVTSRLATARLMLNSSRLNNGHDIALSRGDTAFVMNNDGKTVDVIRTT